MEAKLAHGINLALDWFNSIPNHWLFTIGVVVASIPLSTVIIEGIKKLHFKYTATEMTSHFIDFVVLVTGFLMAAADFVITNGQNAKYLPQFLLVVVPTIKALAPSVYTYSKAIHSWFLSRENETQKERISSTAELAGKLLSEPEADAITEEATLPTRSLSFGNAANGKPEPGKIQL